MGYGGPWATSSDVGSDADSLSRDFIDGNIWTMPASYITIARHVGGVCEMSKTWELKDKTRSLKDYFSTYPGRMYVTGDGSAQDQHIHEEACEDPNRNAASDPIFGAGGGLVFNWYYYNNGARIAVTGAYKNPYHLPGKGVNDDDVHGLGNEFGATTSRGRGSRSWWHDVGQKQGDCHGGSCSTVGTDSGTRLPDASCWDGAQWAIYVSSEAAAGRGPSAFRCRGETQGVSSQCPGARLDSSVGR